MTFCLAFATRHFALVAADTRTRWRLYEGDQDPTMAPVAGWTDDTMKLHVISGGWCAGCLSPDYTAGLVAALHADPPADREALGATARRWAGPWMAALARETPHVAEHFQSKQLTLVIGSDEHGLYRLALNAAGADRFPGMPDAHVVAALPAGVPSAALRDALRRYQDVVLDRDVGDVVRATAALYADAYRLGGPDGSSSPDLVVGVVTHIHGVATHAQLGPVAAAVLLETTDAEIGTRCAPPLATSTCGGVR